MDFQTTTGAGEERTMTSESGTFQSNAKWVARIVGDGNLSCGMTHILLRQFILRESGNRVRSWHAGSLIRNRKVCLDFSKN